MTALAIIFSFMIFMIILNKGHLYFFSIFSLLMVVAISLGVGFGIAAFIAWIFESVISIIPTILIIVIILFTLFILISKGGN